MEGPFSIVSAAFLKEKSSKNRAREENPGTSFTRWPTKIYNTIQHTGHTTIQQWRVFFYFLSKADRGKKNQVSRTDSIFLFGRFFIISSFRWKDQGFNVEWVTKFLVHLDRIQNIFCPPIWRKIFSYLHIYW